ncbi:MAG: tRNA (guanosine(37)-N1)-methyltransferase TrmD [Acidobacteriota bacterium]|nr:MAG: tRNA (guanosine(37)-N1)-methyltransferase TrmD [Acidobacteriota bacterium]
MRCDFVTIFPGFYDGILREGLVAKAIAGGLVDVGVHNLRDWALDPHASVDDAPYGGGAGMVFKAEPFFRAVRSLAQKSQSPPSVVLPSAQGVPFCQALAEELSKKRHLVFLCPRYKGVDERVVEALVDYEISLGDYVIQSGDAAAWAVFEATVRLVPGVVGDEESVETDSFFKDALLEGPQYTRPREVEGRCVPDVLLSGDHEAVAAWRKRKAVEKTLKRRPELLEKTRNAGLRELAEEVGKDLKKSRRENLSYAPAVKRVHSQ